MSDDWLWDGTGEPDPETARLAALLSSARYRGAPPELPRRRASRLGYGAAALAVAAAAAAAVALLRTPAPAWDCGGDCRLGVGEWLETGDEGLALAVADIGTMTVAPGARLRIVETSEAQHRVELAIGHIHASVIAPPRLLVVDTPSARAVDLGCAYDLTVLADGSALLVVETGEVALEHPDRTAVVPAGAAAMTWPGHGPGIPWVTDAEVPWVEALQALDREARWEEIPVVLAASRAEDTLSLWHLLQRVPADRRLSVVTRIGDLQPACVGEDRDPLLALDPEALRRLWERCRLGW